MMLTLGFAYNYVTLPAALLSFSAMSSLLLYGRLKRGVQQQVAPADNNRLRVYTCGHSRAAPRTPLESPCNALRRGVSHSPPKQIASSTSERFDTVDRHCSFRHPAQ